jgi:hypothetical protein
MNTSYPTALGLKVAMAISAGGVLVQQSLYTDHVPGSYSDNTIAEADNQTPPETADRVAPPQQASSSKDPSAKGEDVSVDRDPAPRMPKLEKP